MELDICLLCEDSLTGIFTGIYEAYRQKCNPAHTRLSCGEEERFLFTEYREIEPEEEKAEKVMRTLKRRFGMEGFQILCMAMAAGGAGKATFANGTKALTEAEEKRVRAKADALYHVVVKGLQEDRAEKVLGYLGDPYVCTIFELNRSVSRENQHMQGFLRFQELEQGVLFARIEPKNDLLPYLADHFSDRLPQEHFIIYDERRNYLALHPRGKHWYIQRFLKNEEGSDFIDFNHLALAEEEEQYQELFRFFCHKIAIKERKNEKLQQQMLPLRFRTNMTEFLK